MLSTLTSYRLYSNDIGKSLERVQASSRVARESRYYDETIGKVKTVDEFLGDQRLYTYALKAYGLEDQASSQGFMRKVIESDLTDTKSFANALTDPRYREFAAAFNFKTSATAKVAQSTGQTENLVEAYSERLVRGSTAAAAAASYFERQMGEVGSVDALLDNKALYDVVLKSAGLDPALISKDFVKDIFTRFAGVNDGTGLTPLAALATRFNFQADGTVVPGTKALSNADTDDLLYRYNKATDNMAGPGSAARETAYYNDRITKIDDATDIVTDPRLFDYVMKAYGFDPGIETPAYIASVLSDDPADRMGLLALLPTVNVLSEAQTAINIRRKDVLTKLNEVFQFAGNGSVVVGSAQTAENVQATEDAYYNNYKALTDKKDASAVSYFKLAIGKAKSLSSLMAFDPAFGRDALDVALKAFDLDPKTESLSKIRRALQSDASDPDSYVNKLGDERYVKLAAAFNFDADGKIRAERLVQSTGNQTKTGSLYAETFGAKRTEAQKAVITADTKAYLEAIGRITSVDAFVAADDTVAYALKAYGLEKETLSDTQIRKILTSDLGDKTSYVYTLKDTRYEKFAAAFNFTKDGLVRVEEGGVQTAGNRLSTDNLYLLQTLEEQAGDSNEGTRLALYFLRKSPDIKSTLSILADRALTEVVKTALSLPDSFSQLDIDIQVKVIDRKMKIADLQDAKKLDKFVARFAALYDLKTANSTSSPIMALFGASDSTTGLLASL